MRQREPQVIIEGLTVRFGPTTALGGVDAALGGVGVCGLIGTNGAGKTTLIHTILGMTVPTSGRVSIVGDADQIAFCPDTPTFDEALTTLEVLEESARLGRRGPGPRRATLEAALDEVGLSGLGGRVVRGFSRGMRQRLGIAAALVREPRILILDEPTSALDPLGRDEVIRLIDRLGQRMLVIFSSHILDDVDQVSETLIVLHEGALLYAGPRAEFTPPRTLKDIEVRTLADPGEVASALRARGLEVDHDAVRSDTVWVDGDRLRNVLTHFADQPQVLVRIARSESTLGREFLSRVAATSGGRS